MIISITTLIIIITITIIITIIITTIIMKHLAMLGKVLLESNKCLLKVRKSLLSITYMLLNIAAFLIGVNKCLPNVNKSLRNITKCHSNSRRYQPHKIPPRAPFERLIEAICSEAPLRCRMALALRALPECSAEDVSAADARDRLCRRESQRAGVDPLAGAPVLRLYS